MNSPPGASQPARPAWWQWPTVLSLDAPTIVLAWQALAAGVAGVALEWPERFVLAASVWLAYTADRWIEAGRLAHGVVLTSRHRFHQQWRWPVAVATVAVLAATITVALSRLPARDIQVGLVVAGAAAAYVLSHQWLHRDAPLRLPKEVCIAVLLPAGVWLFVREGAGAPLWATLGMFALLCLTNTALISRWETDVDRQHGQSSLALALPHAGRHLRWLPLVTLVVAGGLGVAVPGVGRPAACTALSAGLLAVVDLAAVRAGWPVARVLADAALLTPLLVLGTP